MGVVVPSVVEFSQLDLQNQASCRRISHHFMMESSSAGPRGTMTSHGADRKAKSAYRVVIGLATMIGCGDQNCLNHGRSSPTSKLVVIAARRRIPKRIMTKTGALASSTGCYPVDQEL